MLAGNRVAVNKLIYFTLFTTDPLICAVCKFITYGRTKCFIYKLPSHFGSKRYSRYTKKFTGIIHKVWLRWVKISLNFSEK